MTKVDHRYYGIQY